MSKHELTKFEQSLDGKIWHPLFLAEHAERILKGDVDIVVGWLDEISEELQRDLDSVRAFFPDETPECRVAILKQRIIESKDAPEQLAAIAAEMLDLDAAIRSTNERLAEYIPDQLFDSDASVEEMGEYALKVLKQKLGDRAGE